MSAERFAPSEYASTRAQLEALMALRLRDGTSPAADDATLAAVVEDTLRELLRDPRGSESLLGAAPGEPSTWHGYGLPAAMPVALPRTPTHAYAPPTALVDTPAALPWAQQLLGAQPPSNFMAALLGDVDAVDRAANRALSQRLHKQDAAVRRAIERTREEVLAEQRRLADAQADAQVLVMVLFYNSSFNVPRLAVRRRTGMTWEDQRIDRLMCYLTPRVAQVCVCVCKYI
ncbi:hypothetical protein T492DRAFT_409645 [Pavlovales sp. CCMP2436]|nr:hypothetical protein T492DRAFT_409645 [Pavlovales sp. CCMP2436]